MSVVASCYEGFDPSTQPTHHSPKRRPGYGNYGSTGGNPTVNDGSNLKKFRVNRGKWGDEDKVGTKTWTSVNRWKKIKLRVKHALRSTTLLVSCVSLCLTAAPCLLR